MPARVGRRLKCLPAFSGHFCYTSKITGSHYLKYPRPWADHVQSRFGHTWLDHQRWLESWNSTSVKTWSQISKWIAGPVVNSLTGFIHVHGVNARKWPCACWRFWGGGGGGGGGLITFSCTSTRKPCYAAARSLASPRMHHATLLYVLLHFHTYVMHLGRKKPTATSWTGIGQALDRQWDWVKNPSPRRLCTHKNFRQDFPKLWRYL